MHWVGEQLKKVELVDCGGLELNPRSLTQTRDGNIARLSGNRISGLIFLGRIFDLWLGRIPDILICGSAGFRMSDLLLGRNPDILTCFLAGDT